MADKEPLVTELFPAPRPPRSDTLERPRINGSAPKEFFVAYERDLTQADIEALKLPRGTRPKSLMRIHASHHSLARCLATGMKAEQAALVTGYSPGRISSLQKDPAFMALVADYQVEARAWSADFTERAAGITLDAMELLHDKMHESPEQMTVPVLLDTIKTFADRTGHGPGQQVNLRVDRDFIDRPPRETYEEWQARRAREIEPPTGSKEELN